MLWICVANAIPCFVLQDYDQFDLANEVDTLEQFLKVEVPPEDPPQEENKVNLIPTDIIELMYDWHLWNVLFISVIDTECFCFESSIVLCYSRLIIHLHMYSNLRNIIFQFKFTGNCT